jgi:hypothetical protein
LNLVQKQFKLSSVPGVDLVLLIEFVANCKVPRVHGDYRKAVLLQAVYDACKSTAWCAKLSQRVPSSRSLMRDISGRRHKLWSS